MPTESQVFEGPFGFYDVPSACTTYSACLKVDLPELSLSRGAFVSIRGPYAQQADAMISLTINKLKMEVGGVSLLPMMMCHLKPDLFEHYRKLSKIDTTQSHYFVVSIDLASAVGYRLLIKEPKCRGFPDGYHRVDWPTLSELGLHRGSLDSIFTCDPMAGQQILYHLLLNWIFGVSKSAFSSQNFIYRPPGLVYNIDVDRLGHPKIKLYRQPICTPTFKLFYRSQDLEYIRQNLIFANLKRLPLKYSTRALFRSCLSPNVIDKIILGFV